MRCTGPPREPRDVLVRKHCYASYPTLAGHRGIPPPTITREHYAPHCPSLLPKVALSTRLMINILPKVALSTRLMINNSLPKVALSTRLVVNILPKVALSTRLVVHKHQLYTQGGYTHRCAQGTYTQGGYTHRCTRGTYTQGGYTHRCTPYIHQGGYTHRCTPYIYTREAIIP